ncbi:CHAP domain-containing protein [bacterium A37T11]|nr:CHAP domain-containing protein [bacterium A37T11]
MKNLASPSNRQTLRILYTAELGVREATGLNDGPRVEEYQHYCGVGKGSNWCSAFVCWCLGQTRLANPKNPWAPALFPAKRIVWNRNPLPEKKLYAMQERTTYNVQRKTPLPGDVFGLYFPELKRIGHCGFIDQCDGKWITTVEGNSNNAVIRKRRLVSTIYQIANWVDPM